MEAVRINFSVKVTLELLKGLQSNMLAASELFVKTVLSLWFAEGKQQFCRGAVG
jgi:hypothetical protein